MKSVWDKLDGIDDHDLCGDAVDIISNVKKEVDEIDDKIRVLITNVEDNQKENTSNEKDEFLKNLLKELKEIQTALY